MYWKIRWQEAFFVSCDDKVGIVIDCAAILQSILIIFLTNTFRFYNLCHLRPQALAYRLLLQDF